MNRTRTILWSGSASTLSKTLSENISLSQEVCMYNIPNPYINFIPTANATQVLNSVGFRRDGSNKVFYAINKCNFTSQTQMNVPGYTFEEYVGTGNTKWWCEPREGTSYNRIPYIFGYKDEDDVLLYETESSLSPTTIELSQSLSNFDVIKFVYGDTFETWQVVQYVKVPSSSSAPILLNVLGGRSSYIQNYALCHLNGFDKIVMDMKSKYTTKTLDTSWTYTSTSWSYTTAENEYTKPIRKIYGVKLKME